MRTYKCDRCGNQFAESGPTDPPQNPSASPVDLGMTNKMPIVKNGRVVVAEVDLCGQCIKGLVEWMSYRIVDRKETGSL